MAPHVTSTLLFKYLGDLDRMYAGKLIELREVLEKWLSYTPNTFPHYTLHTVSHSDEVVRQASSLLFRDDGSCVVQLSAVELYVLGAASYLHDAGMVSSDAEKAAILDSDGWREWVAQGGPGHKKYIALQELKSDPSVADDDARGFLNNLELRRLISEFIRRSHPARSARLALEHQSALGRFALDDHLLRNAIADVCLGHGLTKRELDDIYRFPFQRDIRGEKVNLRFVTLVLRMADLLDMSSDRACPFLMNAAGPLPPESGAHWTQYQSITHRMTSPERIEVRAECHTQSEHRLLQDWLQWLSDECNSAVTLLAASPRHSAWHPPQADLGQGGTLEVIPAPEATYIPADWRLELNPDAALERLMQDIYDDDLAYVRELVQNALDAQRCQLYRDLGDRSSDFPSPSGVPDDVRMRYPLHIRLHTRTKRSELLDEDEEQHVLTISDCGIGMGMETIQKYFLQIGNSYYTTPELRRNYAFTPTSRFGIGFLSVFSASDEVTVETQMEGALGVRLTLTGPRNYLLTERFERRRSGTTVHITLRKPLPQGALTKFLESSCLRVEFPIFVDDLGSTKTLTAETPTDWTYSEPNYSEEGSTIALHAYPISREGIEGEMYVLSIRDKEGVEDWARGEWAHYDHSEHPLARPPRVPSDLVCLNGIAVGEPLELRLYRVRSFRVDIRKAVDVSVSRTHVDAELIEAELRDDWENLLSRHLRGRPAPDWRYLNRLAAHWESLYDYWMRIPGTVPIVEKGALRIVSVLEVSERPVIALTSLRVEDFDHAHFPEDAVVVLSDHFNQLARVITGKILRGRAPTGLRHDPQTNRWTALWENRHDHLFHSTGDERIDCYIFEFPDSSRLGFAKPHPDRWGLTLALNASYPLVEWLVSVRGMSAKSGPPLTFDLVDKLIQNLADGFQYGSWYKFVKLLQAWGVSPPDGDMPLPPSTPVSSEEWEAVRLYI